MLPQSDEASLSLSGIGAISAKDIWAVGSHGEKPTRPFRMHYFGLPCTTDAATHVATNTPRPLVSPTPTQGCKPGWRVLNSPNPDWESTELTDVVALSANDVWTVGRVTNGTVAMRWNGIQWDVLRLPQDMGGTKIAASAADDVWILGVIGITHWNGTQWTPVPLATPPAGPGSMAFEGIDVVSAEDAWVVGSYFSQEGDELQGQLTLIQHWDGKKWSIVPSPNIVPELRSPRNELMAVTTLSANDVWAVGHANGQTLTLHWDGTQWKIVPSPDMPGVNNYLSAVTAASSNDIWAVGSYGDLQNSKPLIMHWNGTKWSIVPAATLEAGMWLSDFAAVSAKDVWAIGSSYDGSSGHNIAVIMHWDGTKWSTVVGPNPGPNPAGFFTNNLAGVAALPSGDVWAVGSTGPGPLVLHYSNSPCASPRVAPKVP